MKDSQFSALLLIMFLSTLMIVIVPIVFKANEFVGFLIGIFMAIIECFIVTASIPNKLK